LRVLYVNHTSRISGGELSLLTLLEGLPGSVEATVACPEGPLAERLRSMEVEVLPIRGTDGSLRLHPTRTPRAVAEMGQAALQVRRAAAASKADLVHANSIRAGLISITAPGRPAVVHVRDCLPPGALSSLTLRALRRADALIANSAYTRSTLGAAGAFADVVYNAVDVSRFAREGLSREEARARLELNGNGPVLAVVAQITPWKGQEDALRMARELLPTHPGLRLLLVGSAKFDSASTRYDNAAYLESLRREAAEPPLAEAVRFLGERDDVPEVLRAVDLLLVPSWEEPFGRAIIEAMAAGVPILATSVGGPPEILGQGEQSCGLVLPPKDPRGWATKIKRLLSEQNSLSRMGENGREAAPRRFGVEQHASEVVGVYERVLAAAA
jgi:glycosyltransferase involved in cell wall biosynthesis